MFGQTKNNFGTVDIVSPQNQDPNKIVGLHQVIQLAKFNTFDNI